VTPALKIPRLRVSPTNRDYPFAVTGNYYKGKESEQRMSIGCTYLPMHASTARRRDSSTFNLSPVASVDTLPHNDIVIQSPMGEERVGVSES
jgi:hypothetical protein